MKAASTSIASIRIASSQPFLCWSLTTIHPELRTSPVTPTIHADGTFPVGCGMLVRRRFRPTQTASATRMTIAMATPTSLAGRRPECVLGVAERGRCDPRRRGRARRTRSGRPCRARVRGGGGRSTPSGDRDGMMLQTGVQAEDEHGPRCRPCPGRRCGPGSRRRRLA